MTERIKPPEGSVLARWSRLKSEARKTEKTPAQTRVPAATAELGSAVATPATQPSTATDATAQAAAATGPDSLPPVDSLTMDSDFTAFLQPKVDEALKRRALKQLFRDPHFNVMDGLDVYIDDYTKSDPIPPEIVREMVQGRYIFAPPPTRINAQGHVEDVPPEELAALEQDAKAATTERLAEMDASSSAELPPPEAKAAAASQLLPPNVGAAAVANETGGDAAASVNNDPAARDGDTR